MERRDAYIEGLKARLEEFEAQATELGARAAFLEPRARLVAIEQLEHVRCKQGALRRRIAALEDVADAVREESWQDLCAGAERTWDELRGAAGRAHNRLPEQAA